MSHVSVEQLQRALGGEISRGKNGPQVVCPGPGHSSADRSLAVSPATNDDGFIVHSFAQDEPIECKDYVRDKVGLPPFQPGNGHSRPQRTIAKAYDYVDEAGRLLFQAVRYEPKGFAQRRPDERGGWIWKLDDVRRVPYRLPELIETLASDRPVFVVEGEKDVDALRAIGVPATCNPQGAGKWSDEYSEHFKGVTVYIIPDNDDAGREHTERVAASLTKAGATVKTIPLPGLPDRGDVSDWIAGGGTAEQLYELAEKPEETKVTGWRIHTISAADLQHKTYPPVKEIVPGLLVEGLTILAGRPKLGKSWAALDICIGVADARTVLTGLTPLSGDVLYCALEDTERRLQSRSTRLLGIYGENWPKRLTLATHWRRLDDGGVDDIAEWADGVPAPRLVALDTLAGVRPQRLSGDQLYDGDYRALTGLQKLAGQRGMGVLVLHHTRKMEADDPLDTVSGTIGLTGCADTVAVLSRSNQGTTLYVRGRDIEESERAIAFDKATCRWNILGDAAEVQRSDTRRKLLTVLLAAKDSLSPDEILHRSDISRQNLDTTLWRMVQAGEIIKVSRGKYIHADRQDLLPSGTCKNGKM